MITTSEGTDYVFLDREIMQFRNQDIAFEGVAGAIRLRSDSVEFILAEGPGRVVYKGFEVRGDRSGALAVPLAKIGAGCASLPEPRVAVSLPRLDLAGVVEWQPGVRRGATPNGFAVLVDSPTPVQVDRGVRFEGRKGAVIVDRQADTVRVIMQDGSRAGYREAQLWTYGRASAYDVTVHSDRIGGRSAGGGCLLCAALPPGLYRHLVLVVDGQTFAPGTHQRNVIVPLMPGEHSFAVQDLAQPIVPRNWQAW